MSHDPDTAIGGAADRFPSTRRTLLDAAAPSASPGLRDEALGEIIGVYWKPAYKHIRRKWNRSSDEAKDLTQGFFASLIERGLLERFDPTRAAFRTYLRTCIDGFVMNQDEAASRLKRGGGQASVAIDCAQADRELDLADPAADPEQQFHREWQRQMFALAVEDLRRQCAASGLDLRFRLFEQYDLAPGDPRPSYGDLAAAHGLPVTTVTNHLAWARRELRRLLLDRLARVTSGEREWRNEARQLLG